MKKLRVDKLWGMFATIPFRIGCLPICYKRTWDRLKYENASLKRMGKKNSSNPVEVHPHMHTS
jgi:hypothetical protein